jgi:hypothetical protein
MSTTKQKSATAIVAKYRARIHDIEPILAQEGEFRFGDVRETQPENHSLTANELRTLLAELRDDGHLQAEREHSGGSVRHCYEWVERSKQALEGYRKQLDTLPCGHRAHIPPGDVYDDPDIMACKYCAEPHSKEVIRESM